MRNPLLLATFVVLAALPAASPAAPLIRDDVPSVEGPAITPHACGTGSSMCFDLEGNAGDDKSLMNLAFGMMYAVVFDLGDEEPVYPSENSPASLDVKLADMTMRFSAAPLAPLATRAFDLTAVDLASMLDDVSGAPPSYWDLVNGTIRINGTDAVATLGWIIMVASFGLCGTAIRRRTSSAGVPSAGGSRILAAGNSSRGAARRGPAPQSSPGITRAAFQPASLSARAAG